MRLLGSITITRPSGGGEEAYISVRLTDEGSHTNFVEARIPLADFAKCVTGMSVDCELKVRGLDLVGLRREHETRIVQVPNGPFLKRDVLALEAVRAREADGWKGRVQDATNMHNRRQDQDATGHSAYEVVFERYVDAEQQQPPLEE